MFLKIVLFIERIFLRMYDSYFLHHIVFKNQTSELYFQKKWTVSPIFTFTTLDDVSELLMDLSLFSLNICWHAVLVFPYNAYITYCPYRLQNHHQHHHHHHHHADADAGIQFLALLLILPQRHTWVFSSQSTQAFKKYVNIYPPRGRATQRRLNDHFFAHIGDEKRHFIQKI